MALYKVTVKRSCTVGRIRIEKGMSVEIASNASPLATVPGKREVANAFKRIYGIDPTNSILSTSFLEVTKLN